MGTYSSIKALGKQSAEFMKCSDGSLKRDCRVINFHQAVQKLESWHSASVHLMIERSFKVIGICEKCSEVGTTLQDYHWRKWVDLILSKRTWSDCVPVLDKHVQYYLFLSFCCPRVLWWSSIPQNPATSFLNIIKVIFSAYLPYISPWLPIHEYNHDELSLRWMTTSFLTVPIYSINYLSKLSCSKFCLFDVLEIIFWRNSFIKHFLPKHSLYKILCHHNQPQKQDLSQRLHSHTSFTGNVFTLYSGKGLRVNFLFYFSHKFL